MKYNFGLVWVSNPRRFHPSSFVMIHPKSSSKSYTEVQRSSPPSFQQSSEAGYLLGMPLEGLDVIHKGFW